MTSVMGYCLVSSLVIFQIQKKKITPETIKHLKTVRLNYQSILFPYQKKKTQHCNFL